MYIFGLRYGVYQYAVQPETAVITPVLTFIHTSFAKIFCQNFVKKNCKHASKVFPKSAVTAHESGRILILIWRADIPTALTVCTSR